MPRQFQHALCQAGPLAHPWRVAAAMTLITFVCRFAAHYIVSWNSPLEWVEPVNVAQALASGDGFANAFGPTSGPTAHCSPAYPILVSVIFLGFDANSAAGANAQRLFNCLIVSIACGALVVYANRCRLNRCIILTSAFFIALVPVNYYTERSGFEAVLVSLAVIVLLLIFRSLHERRFHHGAGDSWVAVGAGLTCGLAGLASPLLLTVSFALAIHLVYRRGRSACRPVLLGAAAAIIVLLPWAVRNRLTLGSWIWTRSNLGVELLVSNQDDSSPLLDINVGPGGSHGREHPYANKEKYQHLIAVGELAFQHEQQERALTWMRTHPGKFARLCSARILLFWLPRMRFLLQSLILSVEALLGFLGLVLALRDRVGWAEELAIVLVFYPLPYYIIEVSSRYRYPLDAILIMLASFAVFRTVFRTVKLDPRQLLALAQDQTRK